MLPKKAFAKTKVLSNIERNKLVQKDEIIQGVIANNKTMTILKIFQENKANE